MRNRLLSASLLAVLLLATAIQAQTKPDFSGVWVIQPEASDFGSLPIPSKYVRKVTHKEPDLKIVTTQTTRQRERTSEITYKTDGRECKNEIRGAEAVGTATWDGSALVIQSTTDVQGLKITLDETWKLSADGQTLTLDVQLGSPRGSAALKIVLAKTEPTQPN